MYKFTLPKGAIVEMLNNRYVYLGNSEFSSFTINDIPRVIEGVIDFIEDKGSDTVLLTPYQHTKGSRVFWQARTQYEIMYGHDDPNIHLNEDGSCFYRDDSMFR